MELLLFMIRSSKAHSCCPVAAMGKQGLLVENTTPQD